MDVLITIAGGLAFFALIIASVLAHELGHLIPAKIFGIKATEYFAGFGPRLWSRRFGETEYGFRALPLGGYVRLLGMYPPRHKSARDTWLQRLADTARDVEHQSIDAGDDGRLFHQQATWKKLVVMSGGILVNLLLAFGLFWGVNASVGVVQQTTEVRDVHECVIPADRTERSCQSGDPVTPAMQAGLRSGDRIVSFNGNEITEWSQLSKAIRSNRDAEARIAVERNGQRVELPVTRTRLTAVPDRWDPSRTVDAGFLGVTPVTERVSAGPVTTAERMWDMSVRSINALVTLPLKVYSVATDMVMGRPRNTNSPMSIVGASRVAGEVASSDLGWGDKVATGASLLGGLNLFLFWLNVIPLPPMDGGHVAGAAWEWIRRRWAAWRSLPDPGPFDTAKMLPVAYIVGAVLLLLGVVLVLADIISPVKIF